MKKKILFVDSDPSNREMFRRTLADMQQEWDMAFVAGARQALDAVAAEPCDVLLVSDSLAGTPGIELLDEVARDYPKTVRFLLSSAADNELIMRCVWGTHQCLSKAREPAELRNALRSALAAEGWLANKKLKGLVSRMRTLPTLPSVYQEVVKAINSPNSSPEQIGELIAKDLAMTAKLLQTVNSAFYGQSYTITTPGEAVLILGLEPVRSLVLSVHTFAQFDKVKPLYFTTDKVWRHSLRVGALAKRIALLESNDQRLAADAYTAGLFHDLGKLLLAINIPDEYDGAQSMAIKRKIPLWEIEKEIFGATHAETAAYLLGLWGLAPSVVEAVALHHSPGRTDNPKFSALTALHAANVLDNQQQPDKDGFCVPEFDEPYLSSLGLTERVPVWQSGIDGQEVKKTARPAAAPAKVALPAGPPARPPQQQRSTPNYRPWLIGAGAAAGLAILAVIAWGPARSGESKVPPSEPSSGPMKVHAREPEGQKTVPVDAPTPVAAAVVEPVANPAPREPAQPAVPSAKAADPVNPIGTARSPAAPAAPTLKLDGIFYHANNPSVIINGKTLFRGDSIRDAKVVAIDKESVTLDVGGQQKVLRVR